MSEYAYLFLPGVPVDRVVTALQAADGKELISGKLASPESSAALAVNAFGWFMDRLGELPAFPPLVDLDWPATKVDVERTMRFPWRGGRHPWLDAGVETDTHLVGVESKRFEPFRDKKTVSLSAAYDRDKWGIRMGGFTAMRDALRSGRQAFAYLDAAQLVKHAFGLYSEGQRLGKLPVLLYLFSEPETRGNKPISDEDRRMHREDISRFADAVKGDEVRFEACSYREWMALWTDALRDHANLIIAKFEP